MIEEREGIVVYQPTYIHPSAKIGKGSKISAFCDIGKNVTIREGSNIQCHVAISNGVKIGRRVFIGPGTVILNDKYPPSPKLQPPIIEDDVIIGGGCVILPGVKLGKLCVIGAGSVVTKNISEGVLVYGNPVHIVGSRETYDEKRRGNL